MFCDKNMNSLLGHALLRVLNPLPGCGIMLFLPLNTFTKMEAEHLNSIANALSDLTQRHEALRGYL
jgi:hypothetical protein